MCEKEASKHKETSNLHDDKYEGNTLRTYEKKEKSHDSYVYIYECSKHFFHSTYEHICTAKDTTIIKMK